jgi:hypothetical protein
MGHDALQMHARFARESRASHGGALRDARTRPPFPAGAITRPPQVAGALRNEKNLCRGR